jgi:Cft2 family RNA processing exonuclease
MYIQFLGGATTVTGSQFLLTTDRARVLIDCGMFQGSPNESIRNRIPFAFEPAEIDAVLLTHAHLDHCGLLPVLVREGFTGPIHATSGTVELATLVLLDSGHLHEEFAKRGARRERRDPERAAEEDRRDEAAFAAAQEQIAAADGGWPRDPEADLRAQPPAVEVDLDAPLYTVDDAEATLPQFRQIEYDEEREVAPGTSSARRSSACASRRAVRSGRSSAPATSAGPARRSSATRRS